MLDLWQNKTPSALVGGVFLLIENPALDAGFSEA